MRLQDQFSCVVSLADGGWVITLSGELDIATAPHLEPALAAVRTVEGDVVLDLRGLQFMDATGIHLIRRLDAAARRYGFDFSVKVDGGAVLRLLVKSGVYGSEVEIVDTPERSEPDRPGDYAVICTDAQARVTLWNNEAERLYGWSAREVLGRSIMELTVGPQDRAVAAEIMDQVQRHGYWEGDFDVATKNGTRFRAHVRNALVHDRDGEIAGFVGVSAGSARAVTESEVAVP